MNGTTTEVFNIEIANSILDNWDSIAKHIFPNSSPDSVDGQKTLLKKYIESSKYGVHRTEYAQVGNNNGRFFATNGSLQGMCRPIRSAISDGLYFDIDICNAHPVLLEQFCKKNRIECECLSYYNANRIKVLESISPNREEAKTVILKIINGGTIETYDTFIEDFFREMELVRTRVVEKVGGIYASSNPSNPMGSITNHLMCYLENMVLKALVEVLADQFEIHPSVLVFDGFMIRKRFVKHDMDVILRKLESGANSKVGYKVSLVCKPMPIDPELLKYTVRPCPRCGIHHAEFANLANIMKRKLENDNDLTKIISIIHGNYNPQCAVELSDLVYSQCKSKNTTLITQNAKQTTIAWNSVLGFLPVKTTKADTQACIAFVNTQMGLCEPSILSFGDKVPEKPSEFALNIDFKDGFYYVDLCDQIRTITYPSQDDAIERLVPLLCKVVFPVQTPECYLLKNCATEKIKYVRSIPPAYIQYYGRDKAGGKDVLKNDLVEEFIKKPVVWRSLKPINRCTFNPDLNAVSKYDFNSYGGFPILDIPHTNTADPQPILNHIRDCWANGDDALYNYILDWFGQAFSTPWDKTGVVLLLYGEQGAGKGFLLDHVLKKHIYGEMCGVSAGLEPLTQRFNSIIMDKLLMIANEVSSGESFHNTFDKLKALITDPTMVCERKGIDSTSDYPNFINFIFTTNNADAVKLGRGDRRYVCLECSDRFKGNYDYFEKLRDSCTAENSRSFFEYCKIRPRSGSVRNIPMTELKARMMEHCTTSVEKFLKEMEDYLDELDVSKLQDEIWDEPHWCTTLRGCCVPVKGELRIGQSKTYPIYLQYCTENKESTKKKHEFKRIFEEKYGKEKKIGGERLYVLKK